MAQFGKVYDSFHEYGIDTYQPTDRFYVRSSVYLPSSDVDPRTGMLHQDARRHGRTQALRMEAERLDQEYANMDASLQARQREKGSRITLRSTILLIIAAMLLFTGMLLSQQGTLAQHQRRAKTIDQKNTTLQNEIDGLREQIAEASDSAAICYAAARNIGMVPATSTQAIHLIAMDTRPSAPGGSVSVTADGQVPVPAAEAAATIQNGQ